MRDGQGPDAVGRRALQAHGAGTATHLHRFPLAEGEIVMGNRPSCLDAEPGRLWTERCEDGRRLLLRPLVVKVGNGDSMTIPAGFVTDFSSIPPVAGWVMAWSKVDIAGVVHDWLYAEGSMDRSKADRIWQEFALCGGHSANELQSWLGRGALFLFGRWAWNRHRVRTAPVPPGDTVASPDNDKELQKCAESLVRQRQDNKLTREAVTKGMGALPAAVDRFESVKKDCDFRLLFLLRYAAAIGTGLSIGPLCQPSQTDAK